MATSTARKPLPALAFLLALSLLTGLVWWRVIHRSDDAKAATLPTCSSASAPASSPAPAITAVPSPVAVTVTVLNSTQRGGLAGQITAILAKDGFKTGTAGNDQTSRAPVAGIAELRYGPAGASAAKLLSFYVPGATLVNDNRTGAGVDLALGAKYATVPTAGLAITAGVVKALARAHITQLPPPKAGASSTPAPSSPSPTTSSSPSPSPSCTTSGASTVPSSN